MRTLLLFVCVLATVKEGYCVTASEIKNEALSHISSVNYLQSTWNNELFNRSFVFVYDVLKAVSANPPDKKPWIPGSYPIGAHLWANPRSSYLLPNYTCWESCSSPIAGDVIAIASLWDGPGGHVGIVTGHNKTTSAYLPANPPGLIVENDWGFRPGQNPICWRFKYADTCDYFYWLKL